MVTFIQRWSPCNAAPDTDAKSSTGATPKLGVVIAVLWAAFAMLVSLSISTQVAWSTGTSILEKALRIALAGVACVYLHCLPTVWPVMRRRIRLVAATMWVLAASFVLYGHATFLVISQQHAGERRAAQDTSSSIQADADLVGSRSRVQIAKERKDVKLSLERVRDSRCIRGCHLRSQEIARLTEELAVLDAEEHQARRRESSADRRAEQEDKAEARRAALRTDPVAGPVAELLGATEQFVLLVFGVSGAVLLEGTAVLGWCVVSSVSSRAGSRDGLPCHDDPVATNCDGDTHEGAASPEAGPDDQILDRIRLAVEAGELVPTQAKIRKYLSCGQSKAGHYKRLYYQRFGDPLI